MTQDILQSDLNIARRLIEAKSPDTEIVAALVRRGVAPAKASQVVNDLRMGNTVRPVDAMLPEFTSGESSSAAGRPSDSGRQFRPHPSSPGASGGLRSGGANPRPVRLLIPVSLVVLGAAVAAGLIWNYQYHATTSVLLDQWESAPSKDDALSARIARRRLNAAEAARWNATALPNGKASTSSASPASDLVLELRPDGLHIGTNLVTSRNAWRAVSAVIGLPTRTNRTDQPRTVIYAFDRHGLLIYSGEGAGADTVMLDYDALGGTNGTTLPFAGTLKFETNLIHGSTDAGALASIKKLGLSNPGHDAGTFRGRCHNLDLYFAYLHNTSHLSVVQINLKGSE